MATELKISEETVEKLYMQEAYAGELEGVSFVATHDKGEHDDHGGALFLLVVKNSAGELFGGEFALNLGEGEIYEYPEFFSPVERVERTVVVADYIPAD